MCIERKATRVDPLILPFQSWPSKEKTRAWSSPWHWSRNHKVHIYRHKYTDKDAQTETHKYTDRDTQTHTMTDKQTEQHHQHNDKCFVSVMALIMRTSRGHTSDVNFSYQRQHAKANHE